MVKVMNGCVKEYEVDVLILVSWSTITNIASHTYEFDNPSMKSTNML